MRWLSRTLLCGVLLSSSVGVAPVIDHAPSVAAYATGRELDRYNPSRPSSRVVVLIHGCCGDRRDMAELARALRRAGAIVLNADVRAFGDGGGWPATYDDVVCAISAGRRIVGDLGADAKLALIAWDDGALVSMAVMLGWSTMSIRARSCAEPVEPDGADLFVGLSGHYGWTGDLLNAPVTDATTEWFGGSPSQVPTNWQMGNPGWWLEHQPSAMRIPVTLMSVEGDQVTADFALRLRLHSIDVNRFVCGSGMHADLVHPRGVPGSFALSTMTAILGLVPQLPPPTSGCTRL